MLDVSQPAGRGRAVLEIIRNRRSVGRVRPEAPPREVIERLIEAATWAPNHHRVEPWHFYVLEGDARAALGEMVADSIRDRADDPDEPVTVARVAKALKAPLRAPYVIAVTSQEDADIVKHRENYAATAAAIQNLLLAATAEGLGAMWRTGAMVDDPGAKTFLRIPPEREIVGFVYVGYPDVDPPSATRLTIGERSTWLS